MGTKTSGKIVFATTDIYGNQVHLSEKTWEHVEQRHPEMVGRVAEVQDTVEDPDAKRTSTERMTCIVYESFGTGPASQGIRVLVEYADVAHETGTTTGKVVTAYPPSSSSSKVGPATILR